MGILNKLHTFAFIARRSPSNAWELLQIRAERAVGLPLFFLSARRSLTYAFERRRAAPVTQTLRPYGNYFLDPARIPAGPIVFSLGVGQDLSFDLALLDRHPRAQLFLCDPTPASARFVEQQHLPENARFFPIAITNTDGRVAVFSDDLQRDLSATSSVSIFRRGLHDAAGTVDSRRLTTLMMELGVAKIDILKMDIEGAGVQVLEDIIHQGILPTQIACEFERPESLLETASYLKRLSALFTVLEGRGYRLYRTRETDKGCQVEILAVRSGASVN